MKLTYLFTEFFKSEKTGGLLLLVASAVSLFLANSSVAGSYLAFWEMPVAGHTLTHWINDGLMAIFFLMIGLELEREIYQGELSRIRQAALPVAGALGGMILPAAIFLLFNYGTPTQAGAGIPMATDIAFALGILSLLGKSVPASLKVFLAALAVIDDLGAILVIAFFYTDDLSATNLLISLGIFGVLLAMNRMRVHHLLPYFIGGVVMWYFMLHSGVHATITGVMLGFAIPFGDGSKTSPSYRLQHWLHQPVAFLVLPVFALANTCIPFEEGMSLLPGTPNGLGIFAGLVIGKPTGILLFTFAGVLLGICSLPRDINWKIIAGAGMLGGIGFTMSIFISLLAFDDIHLINASKISILTASLIAGIAGYLWLKVTLKRENEKVEI